MSQQQEILSVRQENGDLHAQLTTLATELAQLRQLTPVLTVFLQGLSRSAAAAIELLGDAFAGTVVSDRLIASRPTTICHWSSVPDRC